MKIKDLALRLHYMHEEIRELESRIQPVDCGHLKTTVGVLKKRAEEIKIQIEELNE